MEKPGFPIPRPQEGPGGLRPQEEPFFIPWAAIEPGTQVHYTPIPYRNRTRNRYHRGLERCIGWSYTYDRV